MLCIKTGNGPGKSTATMSNFLHALEVLEGKGMYVAFDKVETTATEKVLFNYQTLCSERLEVHIFGLPRMGTGPVMSNGKRGFRFYSSPNGITEEDLDQAKAAYQKAYDALTSGEYDVIACDELITAVEGTLLPVEYLAQFCEAANGSSTLVWVSGSPLGRERLHKPETLEILTRYASQWVNHEVVRYAWPYPM